MAKGSIDFKYQYLYEPEVKRNVRHISTLPVFVRAHLGNFNLFRYQWLRNMWSCLIQWLGSIFLSLLRKRCWCLEEAIHGPAITRSIAESTKFYEIPVHNNTNRFWKTMTNIRSKVNVLNRHLNQKLKVSSFRGSDLYYPSYTRGCTTSPVKSDNFKNCRLLQAVIVNKVCDTPELNGKTCLMLNFW